MRIKKAVVTAAARQQRQLPIQSLIDPDGNEASVLRLIVEEILRAKVEEIGIVVWPGDQEAYAKVVGDHAGRIHFIEQTEPLGYAHAVYCARAFTGREPFLHLVGDHIYIGDGDKGCAERLVEVASAEECSVSAVQITRESQLPYYGAIAGERLSGRPELYRVTSVLEKPTPTVAEEKLLISGLRAGHYLCFFGMHVLTPGLMTILESRFEGGDSRGTTLSGALAELAGREQYLALEQSGRRFNVGARYGMLQAQLALSLAGRDRYEVLASLLELVAASAHGSGTDKA